MNSEKNQKGQQLVSPKGAAVAQTPGPLVLSQEDVTQSLPILHGNIQILQDFVDKRDKNPPILQKIADLRRQLQNVNVSTFNQVFTSIRDLRDEITAQYQLPIALIEEMQQTAALQLPGINLGVQLVQQQSPRVSQAFFNDMLLQRVNENEIEKQHIRERMQKEAGDIAELRSTIDKVDDRLKEKYEKLQKDYDTLADKDTELKRSIQKLDNENKHLREELERKEVQMKKLERKVHELENEKKELEETLSKVREDVRSLKNENHTLKDDVQTLALQNNTMNSMLTKQAEQMNNMMSMVVEMKERLEMERGKAVSNEKSRALISLGQAATNIINKMYKKVHPTLYQSGLIYSMDDIENHMKCKKIYKSNQDKKDQAMKRWTGIQQSIGSDLPDWRDIIKELKRQRNHQAHPDVEPEQALQSLCLLHDKYDMFSDEFGEVKLLIAKWEEL